VTPKMVEKNAQLTHLSREEEEEEEPP